MHRFIREPSSGVAAAHPSAPQTLEEAGLSVDLISPLVLKSLNFAPEISGAELAARLGLGFSVIESSLEFLKHRRDVEVTGGAMFGGPAYRYRITDAGRTRASLFLDQNHYVGTAPVPMDQYRRYMDGWRRRAQLKTTRAQVREAFSHLVVNDEVLDQIGPAINIGHSIFIYGPPGNGKTVISQGIRHLLNGTIPIPYALEAEGSIIRLFDPMNHEEVPLPTDGDSTSALQYDRRWFHCRRPMVMVGGELTLDSLELHYSETAGFYRAPIQTVANGGLLVIDDFGRQHVSPRDLLNRWMVPLESRVDHLTLQTGQKVEMPFSALVVFATNLKPEELVDEAFLRRIQYKIAAQSPTVEEFIRIFENYCHDRGVPFERYIVEHMLHEYYRPRKIQLRACQPRDLINQALSLAEYLDCPRRLTSDLLEAACNSYFVDERDAPGVYA